MHIFEARLIYRILSNKRPGAFIISTNFAKMEFDLRHVKRPDPRRFSLCKMFSIGRGRLFERGAFIRENTVHKKTAKTVALMKETSPFEAESESNQKDNQEPEVELSDTEESIPEKPAKARRDRLSAMHIVMCKSCRNQIGPPITCSQLGDTIQTIKLCTKCSLANRAMNEKLSELNIETKRIIRLYTCL